MGGAIVGGIIKTGLARPGDIVITDASPERLRMVARQWRVRVSKADNRKAVVGSDVVILAVKPHILPAVLDEIREVVKKNHIVISVAAGVPIACIESVIGTQIPVFRAMPNIPVLVEEGATGIAGNRATTKQQRKVVEKIFGAVGTAIFVEESQLDAVTALSGSGPAYIYTVIEALIDGGKKVGLPHEVATRLATQTVLGATKMVRETGRHPAVLRSEVITPGGTTIAGLHELERHGLRSALMDAVESACARSKEIGKQLAGQFPSPAFAIASAAVSPAAHKPAAQKKQPARTRKHTS
jgi:pyrroline-5-carboxylate reductase